MLNMATVANSMGNHEKAITIFDQVLPLLTEVNGEIHVDTATTLRNKGIALRKAGRYADTEAVIARARPIYVELYGEKHHKVARLDNDLAMLRMDQGRWTEAEVLTLEALDIFEEALGRSDPRTKFAAATLVKIYGELERPDDAAIYKVYAEED